jgi:hypothetical protein
MPVTLCVLVLAATAAEGQPRRCEELDRLELPQTTITRAQSVAAGAFTSPVPPAPNAPPSPGFKDLPAFCRLAAEIAPTSDSHIKIEVWMPASGWNGKLMGIGNGAWAGRIGYAQMGRALVRGYATASTDTGHEGNGNDGSCSKPAAAGEDTDYITNGQSNLDLAALAFACDLTRVAGYQWISHGTVFSWLGVTEKHHPLAHQTGSAGADAQLTKIVTWHSEQAAAFLAKLKSFPEGPGTVLDNTVFLWTWSVSVGSHNFNRGPFLLASGKFPLPGGGTLQTGRALKYNGNPHTSLLQSVAALYGVPRMSVYPDWDKGPLPGLY